MEVQTAVVIEGRKIPAVRLCKRWFRIVVRDCSHSFLEADPFCIVSMAVSSAASLFLLCDGELCAPVLLELLFSAASAARRSNLYCPTSRTASLRTRRTLPCTGDDRRLRGAKRDRSDACWTIRRCNCRRRHRRQCCPLLLVLALPALQASHNSSVRVLLLLLLPLPTVASFWAARSIPV